MGLDTTITEQTDWYAMSDARLQEYIGTFIKQQRLQQNKSQAAVAEAANLSRSTLSLLERGESVSLVSLIQVLRVLEQLHVFEAFQVQKQISPLRLAKLEMAKRKRASSLDTPAKNNNDSSW